MLILDEVQTGLGRTGQWFAFQHEHVKPDGLILGKALGGGILPISAFMAKQEVMDVFTPGSHGSTFGGNALACRVAIEALTIIEEERLVEKSAIQGKYFLNRLKEIKSPLIVEARGKGLLIGLEINPDIASARVIAEQLLQRGILTKDTHHTVIRLAPPLTIKKETLDWALHEIQELVRTY